MTYLRRGRLDAADWVVAGAAGFVAGAAAFYLARLWLEREEIEPLPKRIERAATSGSDKPDESESS